MSLGIDILIKKRSWKYLLNKLKDLRQLTGKVPVKVTARGNQHQSPEAELTWNENPTQRQTKEGVSKETSTVSQ